jgi:hypothetical protein
MSRVISLVVTSILAASAGRPESSTALAEELTQLLTQRGIDAVAAVDPEAPDRFVAALAFPNVQLLVVSADYPAPELMRRQIAAKQYREAYIALQQSGVADGKVFLQDLGADGLSGADGDGVDVLYENGVNQTIFDGAPERHKLTKPAYQQKLADADALYSGLLTLLINEVKSTTTQ